MISLELVPRTLEALKIDMESVLKTNYKLDRINIPDIKRLDWRSWEAAELLLDMGVMPIPHFRSQDFDAGEVVDVVRPLINKGIQEILIVSGDPFEGQLKKGLTPIEMLGELKAEFPELKLFAGLDPYRTSWMDELKYCKEKLAAGFDALFSQPFFCEDLMNSWLKHFEPGQIYAGFAPVTSEKSIKYWQNVNKVPLLDGFDTSLIGNSKLANRLIKNVAQKGQGCYLMPIRVKASEFLNSLLDVEE
jgi:methylenetetrahydrofolate reductase (NADPH)